MKEKRKDFIRLLSDLCYTYKDYIDKHNNSRLDVLMQDNMIKMNLYNDSELVDEFGFAFGDKEKDKYYYVSLVLMKELYSRRVVYSKDNIFYEKIDGTGFKIIVNDQDLFDRMFNIVGFHRDIDFYDKIDVSRRLRNKVNRDSKKIHFDERVNISKKLLRTRSI